MGKGERVRAARNEQRSPDCHLTSSLDIHDWSFDIPHHIPAFHPLHLATQHALR